jgi:hypothetical protein
MSGGSLPLNAIIAIAPAILLIACSAPGEHTLGSNHPANPDAPAGVPARAHEQQAALQAPLTEQEPTAHEPPHAAPDGEDAAPLYRCPMHRSVTSRNPDDRCPQCGMKINQKFAPETPR